jgi:DNA-binding response OmpR family regulator
MPLRRALVIDTERRTVGAGDDGERPPTTLFNLLVYLARHPGHVRTRGDILDAVVDPRMTKALTDRIVDTHVKKLRAWLVKRFGPEARAYIATVPGVGYCFDGSADWRGS